MQVNYDLVTTGLHALAKVGALGEEKHNRFVKQIGQVLKDIKKEKEMLKYMTSTEFDEFVRSV